MVICFHRVQVLLFITATDAFRIGYYPSTSKRSCLFAKPPKPTWKGDKGVASYSDNWLLNFHNQAQNEKQGETDSLAIWNEKQEQEQASILEWQDSFQRNGLADFTPPMSFGLNCLMIGGDIHTATSVGANNQPKETKLPWEEQPEADITSLEVVVPEKMSSPELPEGQDVSIQTRLVSDDKAAPPPKNPGLRVTPDLAAVYDCIVDQGLMGAVLQTNDNEETVRELLLEASLALREHGIYVLNTQKISKETMELLESYSQEAGLEWQFELDGISDDNAQVSVARRFNTGAMPKVGRLASRYQP